MALNSALLLSSTKRSRIYLYQEAQGELGGVTDFPKCVSKKKKKKKENKKYLSELYYLFRYVQ